MNLYAVKCKKAQGAVGNRTRRMGDEGRVVEYLDTDEEGFIYVVAPNLVSVTAVLVGIVIETVQVLGEGCVYVAPRD